MSIEKIIIITQKTFLDELVEKYNSKEQVRFYLEHNEVSYDVYIRQHQTYYQSLKKLKQQLPLNLRFQVVEKSFLPSFLFGPQDLIIVIGRDGLVVNTAKYLDQQPILGVNPDPSRIDGTLLQFQVEDVKNAIQRIIADEQPIGHICLAEAITNSGQHMVAVNDLFIGHIPFKHKIM